MLRGIPALVVLLVTAAWTGARADTPPIPPPGAPAPAPAAPEPPAPPGPKPAPILIPDKTEQDYGIVAQNQKIDAHFVLRNVGTVPLWLEWLVRLTLAGAIVLVGWIVMRRAGPKHAAH